MRGSRAEIQLIALTGYGRKDDRLQAEQAGFNLHFTKPVNLKVIRTALEKMAKVIMEE